MCSRAFPFYGISVYDVSMKEKRPAAVFDVDGTIFRSSLFIQLVERMVARGFFPARMKEEYEREHRKWLDREGGYEEYIQAMISAFDRNIKGVHYGDFADVAREVVAEQSKRTYRYTRDLAKDLKQQGDFLLAVSHSPKTILDEFCTVVGFDKTYGMMFEIGPEDRFTGEIIERHFILNKAAVVRHAVDKEGLTYEGSVGVGDTESDIAMLELVDRPICFNPNASLYRHAKLQGWEVVVERKDVIYEL